MRQSILLVIIVALLRDLFLHLISILDANCLQVCRVRLVSHDGKQTSGRLSGNHHIAEYKGGKENSRLGEEHDVGWDVGLMIKFVVCFKGRTEINRESESTRSNEKQRSINE